jgi:hypothetical protein
MSDIDGARPVPDAAGSTWAGGLSVFAASVMIVLGLFEFFEGLVAVVDGNEFLVSTKDYLAQFDDTTWGWTHMLIGAVVVVTGAFIAAGNSVARGVGIGLVSLSALANFMFIPYYPLWALTVLTLDVLVIWAFANAGRPAR